MSTANPTPEVKAPDPEPVVSKPASEYLDRTKLELEIRLAMRQEYETLFEIWKNDALVALEKKQEEIIVKGLKEYFERWKEEQKPPEPEDIQQLLDQEYQHFNIKLDWVDAEGDTETDASQAFIIRELPQTIEKKFYQQFKGRIVDKLSQLEAVMQAGVEKPFEEKVRAGLELFDDSFDVLSEAVALCLNSYGKKAYINKQWVQDHISSNRQWNIVEAQMKVNRLRDFFSKVSTSGQSLATMNRPNFQALQQLAA